MSCITDAPETPEPEADIPDYAIKDNTSVVKTVKKDGSGDFTTIAAALASISDSSRSKQYEVVIYPGVYNEKALIPPDYTHVHAIQPNVVIVTSAGLGGTDPVFDCKKHVKLSNISIISDTGYCIHVDSDLNKGLVVCENLYCEKLTYASVVGIGCWNSGMLCIFRGCTFVNGEVGTHTYYDNSDIDNTHLIFDGCAFATSFINLGQAAGLGNNVCEIIGYKGRLGVDTVRMYRNEYRSVEDPNTYFAMPLNWQIIGHGNDKFVAYLVNLNHGMMVQAVNYSEEVAISGTAVNDLFGVTTVKGSSPAIKGAVYGSLRVDDVQAGAGTGLNPYKDIFQMWKRLGDCSVTPKTLTVTVNGTPQTYTFDADYTQTKPSQATILALVNAVITNAVVSAYTPDCIAMVNTTDKAYVKVQQTNGVLKGMWITVSGVAADPNAKSSRVFGVALEDGVKDEYIPVWIGNAMPYTATDGEYGIGSNGALSSSATKKIGFVLTNRFYRY